MKSCFSTSSHSDPRTARRVTGLVRTLVFLLGLVECFTHVAWGCDNPVFRYALQNWKPSEFQLIFLQGDQPSQKELAVWGDLEQRVKQASPSVNLQLRVVWRAELDRQIDPQSAPLAIVPTDATLALLAPPGVQGPQLIWSGPCTDEAVSQIVDSPLRQELAQRLIGGEAVVWIWLEDKENPVSDVADQSLAAFLASYVDTIVASDARAAEATALGQVEFAKPVATPPVDKSLFWPPRFAVLRVDRHDPQEAILVRMLERVRDEALRDEAAQGGLEGGTEPGGDAASEPTLYAVFGQGRVLGGMPMSRVSPDTIRSACDFLTGACSCEVKDKNPGVDLLMTAPWHLVSASVASSDLVKLLTLESDELALVEAHAADSTGKEVDMHEASTVSDNATAADDPIEPAVELSSERADTQPPVPEASSDWAWLSYALFALLIAIVVALGVRRA
jgi:hypothetical protein